MIYVIDYTAIPSQSAQRRTEPPLSEGRHGNGPWWSRGRASSSGSRPTLRREVRRPPPTRGQPVGARGCSPPMKCLFTFFNLIRGSGAGSSSKIVWGFVGWGPNQAPPGGAAPPCSSNAFQWRVRRRSVSLACRAGAPVDLNRPDSETPF